MSDRAPAAEPGAARDGGERPPPRALTRAERRPFTGIPILPVRRRPRARDRLLFAAVSWAGRTVMDAFGRSARWEDRAAAPLWARLEAGERFIFALWHNRALLTIPFFQRFLVRRYRRATTLVSSSNDGRLIGRIINDCGGDIATGSSSQGGREGLRELADDLARGGCALLTVDGPRGPRYVVKPGAVALARATGWPVVPLAIGVSRALVFPSWDRLLLPLPGGRAVVAVGAPLAVAADLDPAALEAARRALERTLHHLTAEVDRGMHCWALPGRRRD